MGDNATAHAVSIQVTIVPDDPDNPDPASLSNAASNITEALNAAGYTTTAVSTGTKGDFLYTLGQWAWEQREFLVGLAGALASIASICQNARKDREPDRSLTHIVIKTGDIKIDISTESAELERQILDTIRPVLNRPTPPEVTAMVTHRVRGRSHRRR